MKSLLHQITLRRFGTTLGLALAAAAVQAGPNVLNNPSFEIVGGLGSPVTLINPPQGSESAAKDWTQGMITGTFMTTALAPTTDPFAGLVGNMLIYNSDGQSTGSSGNTVAGFTTVELPVGSHGNIDINLVSGAVLLGFVGNYQQGTAFQPGSFFTGPTGGWHQVTFSNGDLASGVIEIQLYAPANGEALLYVDNGFVDAPEPATLSLVALGLVALSLRRRARGAVG